MDECTTRFLRQCHVNAEDVAALTAGIIDSALGFLPADKAENHKQQSEIDALRAALNATVAKVSSRAPHTLLTVLAL